MELQVKSESRRRRLRQFLQNPTRVMVFSFAGIILAGTLLLMLPISVRSGQLGGFLTSLFTATSATCVTGLMVVDAYQHYTVFGQVVILTLIQLGGLGLITITTFFNIAIGKKMGFRTLQRAQESINSDTVYDVSRLVKMIMGVTFGVELAGALVLSSVFVPECGAQGFYIALFTAVSAYCNAGIDILGFHGAFTGMETYAHNPVVLITVALLIIIGGLGFVVWYDLFMYRKTKRLMLHTKIVLLVTGILIAAGAVFFLVFEWGNPKTIGTFDTGDKILNCAFYSVSCRTAGFSSFSLDDLDGVSKMFSIILMFIGAAPGSTGGGIKVTTMVVLVMTTISVVRGQDETVILGRRVQKHIVYKALAVVSISLLACLITSCVISFTTHSHDTTVNFGNALYESVSAFATVGLSVGVTEVANLGSKIVLILTMFIGRVGPVSIALSLAMRGHNDTHQVIPEGKILVG